MLTAHDVVTAHDAVGGTGFVVTDADGRVLVTATLAADEGEADFVAALLEWFYSRAPSVRAASRPRLALVPSDAK